ncbi:hypothetical protein D9M68_575620 [compost metagenome]
MHAVGRRAGAGALLDLVAGHRTDHGAADGRYRVAAAAADLVAEQATDDAADHRARAAGRGRLAGNHFDGRYPAVAHAVRLAAVAVVAIVVIVVAAVRILLLRISLLRIALLRVLLLGVALLRILLLRIALLRRVAADGGAAGAVVAAIRGIGAVAAVAAAIPPAIAVVIAIRRGTPGQRTGAQHRKHNRTKRDGHGSTPARCAY